MRWWFAGLLLLTLGLTRAACSDSDTPTETFTALDDFSGAWSGSVAAAPAGADWGAIELLLVQSGSSVSGTITNGPGESWSVEGTVSLQPLTITARLGGFANQGGACPEVNLWLSEFERDTRGQVAAMSGLITGRCFGTLMTPIRLARAG